MHIHQVVDDPEIDVNVDRSKAGQVGLTQRDVATSLLISSEFQRADRAHAVAGLGHRRQLWRPGADAAVPHGFAGGAAAHAHQFAVQHREQHHGRLRWPAPPTPTNAGVGAGPNQASAAYGNPGAAAGGPQLLSNLVTVGRSVAPEIVNHYNVQPVFDVYANVDRRDLGSVGAGVEKIVAEMTPKLPRGTTLEVRGQIRTMQNSFYRLGLGMIFAVVLVYLLMAVNFQSWLDPFIILMALPGALAGIVWMLFITQTTFSVPSLMGSIMCIGVATANSILLVVFANDQRVEGMDARSAALSAGHTRIRPVLMTAARHDHRHAAHGAGHGRRRRAECAAGPRRDRRPAAGHRHHAVYGSAWFIVCCARNRRWISNAELRKRSTNTCATK